MKSTAEQISTVNKWFYKIDKTIYYRNYKDKSYPVPNADYATFEVMSYVLARDCRFIYAISSMVEGLQIFDEADMDNVIFFPEEIGGSYFADNENLYHYNGHFIEYCNTLALWEQEKLIKNHLVTAFPTRKAWWNRDIDFHKTLTPLSLNFYKDNDSIFYHFYDDKDFYDYPTYQTKLYQFNTEGCWLALRDVDINTFQVLNNIYAKDNNSVFFYSRSIKADPASFEVIDKLFAKDINGIWYNGRLVKVIEDPASFEITTPNERRCDGHLAKDKMARYSSTGKEARITYKGYARVLKKLKK